MEQTKERILKNSLFLERAELKIKCCRISIQINEYER
jgi:hypothetical protein